MHQLSYIKFEPEDFDVYLKIVSSDNVMKYITGKAPTIEESKVKFERFLKVNQDQEFGGVFKVYDKGTLIGHCKLEKYIKEESAYEVGYIILEDAWGNGYATSICKDLIQYTRINDLADYVIALINPENEASRKVLTKNGLESYFVGIENELKTEKLRLKL